MKEIFTMKEVNRLQIIRQCLDRTISVRDAAFLLNLSERQIFRLKAKVRQKGTVGVIHGNRGREPAVKIPDNIKNEIFNLFKTKYFDYNFTHFKEKLEEIEKINISSETVRNILWNHEEELKEIGLVLKKRKRPKHRSRRDRMSREGMLIQMDGSYHDWFKTGTKCALLGLIDDATGKVDALFFEKETTLGYMTLIKKFSKEKGLPLAFYADKHSCFKITRHGGTHVFQSDENLTQIERALEELGIKLISAGSPQAKGRIERLFGTFQNRLIPELRSNNIKNITDANIFLQNEFILDCNKKFTKIPKETEIDFRALPKTINLDRILSHKEERTVKHDNTISFKGTIYQILPNDERISYAKARVEVYLYTDNALHTFFKDKELQIKEISKENKTKKDLILEEFMLNLEKVKLTHTDKITLSKPDKITLA